PAYIITRRDPGFVGDRGLNVMRIVAWAMVSLMVLARPDRLIAEDAFFLKGGEKIVFFGDSITQAGLYVEYVEAFLLTRFPDKHSEVVTHGISSETVSGSSEPAHQPRRPNALDRFTRDVATPDPDVVVVCFGMNDGNYHPFEPTRLAAYQDGVNKLI